MRNTLAALALALPMTLMAQEDPSYTYVEGGISFIDPPEEFGDGDTGLRIRSFWAIDSNLFLRGDLSTHRFDESRDVIGLGVGWRMPVNAMLEAYGAADFLYDFGEADSGGFRIEGAGRSVFDQQWDTALGLRFERIDSESFLQVFGNTWYAAAEQLSVGGELAIGDFNEILVGARYRF